jgi:hypothetical protein
MANETKGTNYLKQVFDKVVVQLIWTIIVAIVTAIVTYMVSKKFQFTELEIGLMVAISIVIIGFISYLIYKNNNRKLPIFNPVDCNFQMVREERVHKWINETDYVHKRRYTLKALRTGLTNYKDKFQWTGGEYTLTGGNSDFTIERDGTSKNVFDQYLFKFKTPLNKGDIIEVEATWRAKGPAKPFFSTTIEEPTDLLVMSIMLYPESNIKDVNCEIESYKGAKIPNEIKKEKLNSDGEFVWQVKNPKLLHHYEINWNTI